MRRAYFDRPWDRSPGAQGACVHVDELVTALAENGGEILLVVAASAEDEANV